MPALVVEPEEITIYKNLTEIMARPRMPASCEETNEQAASNGMVVACALPPKIPLE